MSLALFNTVPVGAIEVLVDCDNQPWFKRAHVGQLLKLENIIMFLKDLDKCEQPTRSNFILTISNTYTWSGPKKQQNKTDVFLSVYDVFHVIIKSKMLV